MTPGHARGKNGKRYRHHVSAPRVTVRVATGARGWRIPAEDLEGAVAGVRARHLRDPACAAACVAAGDRCPDAAAAIPARLIAASAALDRPGARAERDLLGRLVTRADIAEDALRAEARLADLFDDATGQPDADGAPGERVTVHAPLALERRRAAMRLDLEGASASARHPDTVLMKTLVEGHARTARYLDPGAAASVSDIAAGEGTEIADVWRSMRLAWLTADLVARILDGTQPAHLSAERPRRIGDLPLDWEAQRRLLG